MKLFSLVAVVAILAGCGGGGGDKGEKSTPDPNPAPVMPIPDPKPDPATPAPKNTAPIISNVIILDENEGEVLIGDLIKLSYDYSDAENDIEGSSRIRWFRDETEITGALALDYILTIEDAGRAIRAEVTPVAATGTYQGKPVFSSTLNSKPLLSAELSFSHIEDQKLIVGSEFNNTATKKGAGTLTYTSSDDTIVTVDSSGLIVAKKVGNVSITATVETDGTYKSESVSYDVDVMHAEINIIGWSGETFIHLEHGLPGVTMKSTSDVHCALNITDECTDYTRLEFNESYKRIPLNATSDKSGYFQFNYGDYQASLQISPSEFTMTTGMQIVEFKGRLWIFGGRDRNEGSNEIWSSVDGRSWEQMETDPNRLFLPRNTHQVREFKGKLWMTGGRHEIQDQAIYYNDVWSSDNGIHWTLETDNAAFPPKGSHQMTVANGKLWLTGNNANRNDFSYWSSADGVNWKNEGDLPLGQHGYGIELETVRGVGRQSDRLILNVVGRIYISDETGKFPSRASFIARISSGSRMVHSNGNLWLIDTTAQRVYKLQESESETGGQFYKLSEVEVDKPFPSHDSAQLVDFKNRLWLIAGRSLDSDPLGTQSFSSTDGVAWKKETDDAEFSERTNTIATTFNGDLILAGGRNDSNIFKSRNGIQWEKMKPTGQSTLTVSSFYNADMKEFKNKLWLVNKDGLHVSDSGESWAQVEASNFPSFGAVQELKLVVNREKLWLISVDVHERNYRKRVYSSIDGVNWDTVTKNANFEAVSEFKVVSFKDYIWIVQGKDAREQRINKSYSSFNGIAWGGSFDETPVLNNAIGSDVAVFKNHMWSIGGSNTRVMSNSVFSTLDGANWNRAKNSNLFSPRRTHSLVATEDRLYVIAGETELSAEGTNDVWSTDDGYTWVKAFQNKAEFVYKPKPDVIILEP